MRVPNRHTRRTGLRLLAVGAALALILAACGGDDDDDAAASATTTTTAAKSESSTTTGASGSSDQAATVAVATTSLGDVLVNESGRTLYVFDKDTTADASTCTGGCATTWPALTVTGNIVLGDGLDDSMFTTFARDDGAMQVSVNGHPLYTYAADTKPGDTNGQGVGGIWYVVGANGQKLETGEAEGASSSSSGGSGY